MTTSRPSCVPSFSKSIGVILTSFHLFCRFPNFTRQPVFFYRLAKTYIQPPAVLLFLNIISGVAEHYDPYLIPYNMIWSDALEWLWTRDINLCVGMWAAGVFAVARNDQRLRCFFWDYLRCRPLPRSAPSATLFPRERRVHAGLFFRIVVKQVKLKETGLQCITELSSHKYTFFQQCPVSCYLIFSQKNSSTSSKVRPLKWGKFIRGS